MAKYEVIIQETLEHTVILEASSLQEAKEKAHEVVMSGPDSEYDTESLGTNLVTADSLGLDVGVVVTEPITGERKMSINVDKIYSVLCANDGEIDNFGPFESDNEAMDYIRKHSSEFDLDEKCVYILTPDHRLISVLSDDLEASPDAAEEPDDDTNEESDDDTTEESELVI